MISKGAVIIMDNAAFHKRKDIIAVIKSHGCFIEYLPPYSPELNPIEKKWAKDIRCKLRCSIDELFGEHFKYVKL